MNVDQLARWAFILLTALLVGFGLVMVTSTTTGHGEGAASFRSVFVQLVAALIGGFTAWGVSRRAGDWLRRGWVVVLIMAGSIGLLLLVQLVGREVNGARRWLDLGPIKLQPSELAKLALIVVTASYLTRVAEKVRLHWNGVMVPLIFFGIFALLVYKTQDLGSVVVMAVVLWSMLFFSGSRWMYVTMLGLCFLPLVSYLAVHMESYRRERIMAFMDPWNASGPAGYHLQQSYMTIASGGTTGAGLGQGPSRNAFLPERHTDFIYAVVCEELGMVGGGLLAFAYLALVGLGLFIAFRSRDRFARLIAVGAVMLVGVQAFWNMLVVTGTVPTKGLTLPFISYGGTSMVICLLAIGLVDAVARENIQRVTETSGSRISRIGAGVSTRMRRLGRRSQVV